MGRTLADDLRDDFPRVFLNLQEFGETVLVKKPGGSWRSITAIVSEHPGSIQDGQHHVTNGRTIEVIATTDPLTGIDDPRLKWSAKWDGIVWDFAGITGQHTGAIYVRFVSGDVNAAGQRGAGRL